MVFGVQREKSDAMHRPYSDELQAYRHMKRSFVDFLPYKGETMMRPALLTDKDASEGTGDVSKRNRFC